MLSSVSQETLSKAQSMVTMVSAAAVPLVLAAIGYLAQRNIAESGLKKDYVQIAVGVLTGNAKDNGGLRGWAVSVLGEHSPVHLSAEARSELQSGRPLWLGGSKMAIPIPHPPDECTKPAPTEAEKEQRLKCWNSWSLELELNSIGGYREVPIYGDPMVRRPRSSDDAIVRRPDIPSGK